MGNSPSLKKPSYSSGGGSSVLASVSSFLKPQKPQRKLADFATTKLSDGTLVLAENVCKLYVERKALADENAKIARETEKEKDEEIEQDGEKQDFDKDAEKLFRLMVDRFGQIRGTKEGKEGLLSLPRDVLIALLESDELQVQNEYDMLLLVGAWADRRIEEERQQKEEKQEKMNSEDAKEEVEEAKKQQEEERKKKAEEEEKKKRRILSDSDFARQLQDELNAERLSREAEDEILARELQKILNEDDKSTTPVVATPASKKDEDEFSGVVIPDWKLEDDYLERLKELTDPLMEYIRFPQMASGTLGKLDELGFVPHHLMYEALRHHSFIGTDAYTTDESNPRLRSRGYLSILEWDPRKKSSYITVSPDQRTITATTSCAHKTILDMRGTGSGAFSFEVVLEENAGCYSAIGVATEDFQLDGGVLGIAPNSWAMAMYPGSHSAQGDRRKWCNSSSTPLQKGTRVRVDVDVEAHIMSISVNDAPAVTLNGVSGVVYPALTMCHSSPAERYKLVDIHTHK